MPLLAKKFTVVAVDLRGVGGSSATPGGYESPNMAEDIRQLTQQLKLEQVYIVGHDIGGMVAYAFARLYPQATRGVMILDVPLPGIDPWEESIAGPDFWHIPFHQMPNLPEKLLAGRQAVYFRYILPSRSFQRRRRSSLCGVVCRAGSSACRIGVVSCFSSERGVQCIAA